MADAGTVARQDTAAGDWRRADEAAAALKLLADATRLRLYIVLRRGEACVCELAAELGLAENLVSHHLGILRRAGLVEDRRDPADARWVYYHLNLATLAALHTRLGALFDPAAVGTRTPTCGPAAVLAPRPAGVLTPRPPLPAGRGGARDRGEAGRASTDAGRGGSRDGA